MRTRPRSSAPESEPGDARATKRTRTEDGAESLLSSKRQKKPTQLPEIADDTTKQDDITYMRTQPRPRAKAKPKTKSVPNELSQLIDLTLDDELDDVPATYAKPSKLPHKQAKEQSGSTSSLLRPPPGSLPKRPPAGIPLHRALPDILLKSLPPGILLRPPPRMVPEGPLGEDIREWVNENSVREEPSDSRYAFRKKMTESGSKPPEISGSDDSLLGADGPEEVSGDHAKPSNGRARSVLPWIEKGAQLGSQTLVNLQKPAHEQSDSKYALRKKAARHGVRPLEVLGSDDTLLREDGSEDVSGEETWVLSKETGRRVERNATKGERMKAKRQKRHQEMEKQGKHERKQDAKSEIVSTAIMFTISAAIAFLEKPLEEPDFPKSIRYDRF